MKPVSRKTLHSSNFLRGNFNTNFGTSNTVASIKGTVKKLGANYQNALIILYSKKEFLPYAASKPNENGQYQFLGLNKDFISFVAAFDNSGQFNAVIQDNVVPK